MTVTNGCRLRRTVYCVFACIPALGQGAAISLQNAGAYPTKAVRIIVGNAPGGGTDMVARLVGHNLGERWSQPVIIDNRGGGVGVIAMELSARAAPDGHTLLLSNIQMSINTVIKKTPIDVRRAYVPIVKLTSQPYVLAVNPSLPVNSVKDLIAFAKTKPGAIRFGSPGSGSPAHIGIELFSTMAGIEMLHVPYKGNGPAMIDLIGGQIQLLFGTIVSVAPQARSGRLKALAVTSLLRNPALPDLPTIAEAAIPGYELGNSYGFYAPAGTPAIVVNRINQDCNRIIGTPEFKAKLAAEGVDAAEPNSPAQYRSEIGAEVVRLEKFFATPGLALDRFR